MIWSLIYSRATSYLHYFNICILAPYAFYLSYRLIMVKFLIKAASGGEALIGGWHLF